MIKIEQLPIFETKVREYTKKYGKKSVVKDLNVLKEVLLSNPI
jgi:hypothetical protein